MTAAVFHQERRRRLRLRHRECWLDYNDTKQQLAAHLATIVREEHSSFERLLDLGCHHGEMTDALRAAGITLKDVIFMDGCLLKPHGYSVGRGVVCDDHVIPLVDDCCDGVMSVLHLHSVSAIASVLREVARVLCSGGLFMGTVFGENHVREWRLTLLEAEAELTGGAHGRVMPFISLQDGGLLLQQAGLCHGTAEFECMTVYEPSMALFIKRLRAMGESSCLSDAPPALRRSVWQRAVALYDERYRTPQGVAVSIEVITLRARA